MVVLGMELYRISDLPMSIRVKLPPAKSPNAFAIKKIVQESPIRVEWEIMDSKPSDWLMKDFPADLVK